MALPPARSRTLVRKTWAGQGPRHQPGWRKDQKQQDSGSSGGWQESLHPRGYGGKWIQKGDSGQEVKKVQNKLGIKANGKYDEKTRQAVIAYQKAHGLKVDGIVGRQTFAALNGRKDAASIAPGKFTHRQKEKLSKDRGDGKIPSGGARIPIRKAGWEERLHPRGWHGRWVDVLSHLARGSRALTNNPNVHVTRVGDNKYSVTHTFRGGKPITHLVGLDAAATLLSGQGVHPTGDVKDIGEAHGPATAKLEAEMAGAEGARRYDGSKEPHQSVTDDLNGILGEMESNGELDTPLYDAVDRVRRGVASGEEMRNTAMYLRELDNPHSRDYADHLDDVRASNADKLRAEMADTEGSDVAPDITLPRVEHGPNTVADGQGGFVPQPGHPLHPETQHLMSDEGFATMDPGELAHIQQTGNPKERHLALLWLAQRGFWDPQTHKITVEPTPPAAAAPEVDAADTEAPHGRNALGIPHAGPMKWPGEPDEKLQTETLQQLSNSFPDGLEVSPQDDGTLVVTGWVKRPEIGGTRWVGEGGHGLHVGARYVIGPAGELDRLD